MHSCSRSFGLVWGNSQRCHEVGRAWRTLHWTFFCYEHRLDSATLHYPVCARNEKITGTFLGFDERGEELKEKLRKCEWKSQMSQWYLDISGVQYYYHQRTCAHCVTRLARTNRLVWPTNTLRPGWPSIIVRATALFLYGHGSGILKSWEEWSSR